LAVAAEALASPRMELLHSETAFDGAFVDLAKKRFRRADGSEVERQVVEHPGSVGILAHDAEFVHLVRQPREAVGDDALLELPAGTLDKEGETELQCAERELAEEVGLRAERWSELHAIYPSPGFLSERLTIFEATGLSAADGEPDEGEEIEIVRLPLADLDAAIETIQDAKTLVGLLLLRCRTSRSG
jgi:8-oxo-dGTP pyrophosphatase MutT (NUDIX family)